jgi:hypothetical protein
MTSSGSETGNGRLLAMFRIQAPAGGRLVGLLACWLLGLLARFVLCGEMMAVCCQIRTKHINTLCGGNVELLNVKLVVHIVTTGL